jgi:hypothetical protein
MENKVSSQTFVHLVGFYIYIYIYDTMTLINHVPIAKFALKPAIIVSKRSNMYIN